MEKLCRNCTVLGCKRAHASLYQLPGDGRRDKWLSFIFQGNVHGSVPKRTFVCAGHFSRESFTNFGQYEHGLAKHLILTKHAIPTLRGDDEDDETASTSAPLCSRKDVGCQTDLRMDEIPATPQTKSVGTQLGQQTLQALYTKSVGTQLGQRTLQAHFRSKAIQVEQDCRHSAVLTSVQSLSPVFGLRPSKRPRLDYVEEEDDASECPFSDIQEDSDYNPVNSVANLSDTSVESEAEPVPPHKTRKYIVYEDRLLELFQNCPVCTRRSEPQTWRVGTFWRVKQTCSHCDYQREWQSQPLIGSTPAGNLQLSAAVYISGASFYTMQRVFRAMQLQMFVFETFRRHGRMFIEPAIVHAWNTTQDEMLRQLSEKGGVILGGDMRADSPGHTAKFGSYSLMDLESSKVVSMQLVQRNQVGGSCHMELKGLQKSLDLLRDRSVTFESIVTDMHPQVQKYLRDNDHKHWCDVWHFRKGIIKKIQGISKLQNCGVIKKWIRAIKHHVYWTAQTSQTPPERRARWLSILNHIRNVHRHDDPHFPACLHKEKQTTDGSKWLQKDNEAFRQLEKAISNPRVLNQVEKLSPHHQTSTLESYHSVILRFAPKNVVFPYLGMLCRLYLATIHFNENVNRPQARSAGGRLLYKVTFPKALKGECRSRTVKEEKTFRYADELMDLIFDQVIPDPEPFQAQVLKIDIPPDLSSECVRPDREEVIARRFNRSTCQVEEEAFASSPEIRTDGLNLSVFQKI